MINCTNFQNPFIFLQLITQNACGQLTAQVVLYTKRLPGHNGYSSWQSFLWVLNQQHSVTSSDFLLRLFAGVWISTAELSVLLKFKWWCKSVQSHEALLNKSEGLSVINVCIRDRLQVNIKWKMDPVCFFNVYSWSYCTQVTLLGLGPH